MNSNYYAWNQMLITRQNSLKKPDDNHMSCLENQGQNHASADAAAKCGAHAKDVKSRAGAENGNPHPYFSGDE